MLPKLICFDWDGTLINTDSNIEKAMIATGQEFNIKSIDTSVLDVHRGQDLSLLFKESMGLKCTQDVFEAYHKHYDKLPHATLFEGVRELLSQLRSAGMMIAIVTNKSRIALDRELKLVDIESLIDSTWTADEHTPKPSPVMILSAVSAHLCDAEEAWMIGDSMADLYAASRAGCARTVIVRNHLPVPKWVSNVTLVPSITALHQLISEEIA